jgi:hypothetical protein
MVSFRSVPLILVPLIISLNGWPVRSQSDDDVCKNAGSYLDIRQCLIDQNAIKEAKKEAAADSKECKVFSSPADQLACMQAGSEVVNACKSFSSTADRMACIRDKSASKPPGNNAGTIEPYCLPMKQSHLRQIERGERVVVRGVGGCWMTWN